MISPVIVWIAIIGLFMAFIVIRFTVGLAHHFHKHHPKRMRLFSIGSEREEFYVPGDRLHDEHDQPYDEN